MVIKSFTAPALYWLSYQSGASVRRALKLDVMRIIMIHGVGTEYCSAEAFEAQMKFLRRHFIIVPLGALAEQLHRPNGAPGNEVALTFDDGLKNNFTIAYPVLKRLGVPATFFVCPGLIESGRWLWNHEARARWQSLPLETQDELAASFGLGEATDETVVEWMKTLPQRSRSYIEETIREATPHFSATPRQHDLYDLMNWQELAALDAGLVSVGAHSLTHPILTQLPAEQQMFEITESRRLLETRLGRAVKAFCYPNGANNPAVVKCVREHFDVAVTAQPGFVTRQVDAHLIPRISIAGRVSLLAWRMHRPTS
jgi:peptidoglycan/xylan/chitin deacetylase (PgdA/CDA1 family)